MSQIAAPFDNPDWVYELKHDGYRALAYFEPAGVRLISRNARRTTRFAPLARSLAAALPGRDLVLDGEIAVMRPDGRTDFKAMQSSRAPTAAVFLTFDALLLDGRDVRQLPQLERKELLRELVPQRQDGPIHFVDFVVGAGVALYQEACPLDLEGIVAKWSAAPYGLVLPDGRSSWIKVKNPEHSQGPGHGDAFGRQPR